MKYISYIIISILAICLIGTFLHFNNQNNELKNTVEQKDIAIESLNNQVQQLQDTGILKGIITIRSGNCMPMACLNNKCPESHCFTGGVSRKVYIRKVADGTSIDFCNHLKENATTELIKTLTSDSNGSFVTTLPVGEYSLFVEDNEKFCKISVEDNRTEYCNLINNDKACAFEIKKNQITEYTSQINNAGD